MPDYDVVVIGSGPAGYAAAFRAAQLGGRVAMVEKDLVGGTCLNRGCIPTKSLLEATAVLDHMNHAETFGLACDNPRPDMVKLIERKERHVAKLRGGVEQVAKGLGIEIVRGTGTLAGQRKVSVAGNDGGVRELTAKAIIIASGSEPLELKALPFDHMTVLSSTSILELREVPGSLLIIGGGYIGCEFATVFASLGTKVTIVEMLNQLLPGQDVRIGRTIQAAFKKRAMALHLETKVEKLDVDKRGATATLSNGETIKADKVLVSVGRKLNADGLGLETMGIRTEKAGPGGAGRILVDDYLETNIPGIYAVGDVIGNWLLAHVGHHEGLVAAENAMGGMSKMDYRAVPAGVYTRPEIAMVGLDQARATEAGREVITGRFPFGAAAKAVVADEPDGFVQIVADAKTKQILGVQIVGPHATDLISEAALLVQTEATLNELVETIHPHPTLSEALMEAGLDALGRPLHTMPKRK
ncbi:MAG: dihydrolipoyl dehydrogenase [Verrucomicrobia bacterium]|nr:dihydrolipoyl dehydrogenase [Verrucomicrobiota bacterium]